MKSYTQPLVSRLNSPARRAFLPRLATITSAVAAALWGAPATASMSSTPSAPTRRALPLAPAGYGAQPQYQEALAIALTKAEPVLRQLGAVPINDSECDAFFRAIEAIAKPIGLPEAAADARGRVEEMMASAPNWSAADSAINAIRWEYQLFAEGAYFLGLAAGLHLAAQQQEASR